MVWKKRWSGEREGGREERETTLLVCFSPFSPSLSLGNSMGNKWLNERNEFMYKELMSLCTRN